MPLEVASLNSGSNGNCYYIGNESDAVLVDAGISCREIEKRLKRCSLDINKIRGVFISHEHSDHIRGLRVLSKKYNLPIYVNTLTARFGRMSESNPNLVKFEPNETIHIGSLEVKSFPKYHDAANPVSFVIQNGHSRVGVMTDIGEACENVIAHLEMCDALFLEANYDSEMLHASRYPKMLKDRISGGRGHLSNEQALDLVLSYANLQLKHLFLCHLSNENNDPELVLELFNAHLPDINIIVASRFKESEVVKMA